MCLRVIERFHTKFILDSMARCFNKLTSMYHYAYCRAKHPWSNGLSADLPSCSRDWIEKGIKDSWAPVVGIGLTCLLFVCSKTFWIQRVPLFQVSVLLNHHPRCPSGKPWLFHAERTTRNRHSPTLGFACWFLDPQTCLQKNWQSPQDIGARAHFYKSSLRVQAGPGTCVRRFSKARFKRDGIQAVP